MQTDTGKFGYVRIWYKDIVPRTLKEVGKSIRSEESEVLVVKSQSESTPHIKKRIKCSTPSKIEKENLHLDKTKSKRKIIYSELSSEPDNNLAIGTGSGIVDEAVCLKDSELTQDLRHLQELLPSVIENLTKF